MMKNYINWAALYRIIVLHLKIQPSEFWKMTIPEFLLLTNSEAHDSEEIEELIRFIDDRSKK